MSSWKSHIPPHLKFEKVTGLGMNLEELQKNPQLTDMVIHDLNQDWILPFEGGVFPRRRDLQRVGGVFDEPHSGIQGSWTNSQEGRVFYGDIFKPLVSAQSDQYLATPTRI